jgi:hypothetical protein
MTPCKVCGHIADRHNFVHGDPNTPIRCKDCPDGFCVPGGTHDR